MLFDNRDQIPSVSYRLRTSLNLRSKWKVRTVIIISTRNCCTNQVQKFISRIIARVYMMKLVGVICCSPGQGIVVWFELCLVHLVSTKCVYTAQCISDDCLSRIDLHTIAVDSAHHNLAYPLFSDGQEMCLRRFNPTLFRCAVVLPVQWRDAGRNLLCTLYYSENQLVWALSFSKICH